MAVVDKQRFDVRMSPELANQLESISSQSGLSRAEVFRRAIALYKEAKELQAAGGKVLFKDANSEVSQLVGL